MTVAWVLTLSSLIGGGAWVYLTGHKAEHVSAVPQVTMSLNNFRQAEPEATESAAIDAASPVNDGDSADDSGGKAGKSLGAAGLLPHPDPALVEKSDLGPLPIVAKDGRTAWRVYARPFSRLDSRPKIAIVVTALGVSDNATKSAIEMLPGAISLSFQPFTKKLPEWIDKGRAAGHEVLIDLPMEPLDFPQSDPGPHTILASVPIGQNLRQLGWILSRATGYVGVSIYMGSNLTSKPRALSPVLTEIKTRGLMLFDTRENPLGSTAEIAREIGLATAASDLTIDGELSTRYIDTQLAALEKRARERGFAVATARPYPVTLTRLKTWSATLEKKGIVLAPVSALPTATAPTVQLPAVQSPSASKGQ